PPPARPVAHPSRDGGSVGPTGTAVYSLTRLVHPSTYGSERRLGNVAVPFRAPGEGPFGQHVSHPRTDVERRVAPLGGAPFRLRAPRVRGLHWISSAAFDTNRSAAGTGASSASRLPRAPTVRVQTPSRIWCMHEPTRRARNDPRDTCQPPGRRRRSRRLRAARAPLPPRGLHRPHGSRRGVCSGCPRGS